MKPDEAIEILKNMKWSITTKFNAVNNSTRALDLAISALEKQEQDRWIPFKCRDATDDDCTSFDYIMEGNLPEDGQTILITVIHIRLTRKYFAYKRFMQIA